MCAKLVLQVDAERDLHGVERLGHLIGNAEVDLLDSAEQSRRPAGIQNLRNLRRRGPTRYSGAEVRGTGGIQSAGEASRGGQSEPGGV